MGHGSWLLEWAEGVGRRIHGCARLWHSYPSGIHVFPVKADERSVGPLNPAGPRRRGTLRSMQSAAQILPQPSVPGLSLVEADAHPLIQVVGVSAAWRKLLMQAEMAAPHLQVAAIEGEHGI